MFNRNFFSTGNSMVGLSDDGYNHYDFGDEEIRRCDWCDSQLRRNKELFCYTNEVGDTYQFCDKDCKERYMEYENRNIE